MSFSASWPGEVCQTDADADLDIAKATLSPPLEGMADDVKDAVAACARAAAEIVRKVPSATGLYAVQAYGHVRQPDSPALSSITVTVAEREQKDATIPLTAGGAGATGRE